MMSVEIRKVSAHITASTVDRTVITAVSMDITAVSMDITVSMDIMLRIATVFQSIAGTMPSITMVTVRAGAMNNGITPHVIMPRRITTPAHHTSGSATMTSAAITTMVGHRSMRWGMGATRTIMQRRRIIAARSDTCVGIMARRRCTPRRLSMGERAANMVRDRATMAVTATTAMSAGMKNHTNTTAAMRRRKKAGIEGTTRIDAFFGPQR